MPTPDNPTLYAKARKLADQVYDRPSAYKSGYIVKKYKELGGTYSNEAKKEKTLTRWFKEEWKDIGGKDYPVYRPTKRANARTPTTASEVDPKHLRKQIFLKQRIRGTANLPKFKKAA